MSFRPPAVVEACVVPRLAGAADLVLRLHRACFKRGGGDHHLEGRSRRINAVISLVIEGVPLVFAQGLVRPRCNAADKQVRIRRGRRHHADDFAGCDVDHDGAAGFDAESPDRDGLKLRIDRENDISAWLAGEVLAGQAIDHAAGGVLQQAFVAGLTLERHLAIGFDTLLADAHGRMLVEPSHCRRALLALR